MTITILKSDPAHCKPLYTAHQLQTSAWGWGETETEARVRMCEHPKYRPEAEPEVYEAALELTSEETKQRDRERIGLPE